MEGEYFEELVYQLLYGLSVEAGFYGDVSECLDSHPVVLFVCFVALHPKSTAMVMVGGSVHLATLFSWANLNKGLTSTLCTYFRV